MAYKYKFQVNDLPLTRNGLKDRRWERKKESEKWEQLIRLKIFHNRPENGPLNKATLHLVRHSAKCPDYDGLVSSFKYVVDGLVKCGILKDDNMKIIERPLYEWKKAKRNEGFITVEVTEVE